MTDIKLYLAPMAGAADAAMRSVCRMHGADGCTTEMVSAAAVWYKDRKTFELARLGKDESDCAVQIFGHEPEMIANAVKVLYDKAEIKPRAFDINMGCPVKKVVSNGDGSALMRDPPLAGRIIEAAVKVSPVPVTVKMRTGWDKDHINCVELCKVAEESGASAVCIHGRTREDMYSAETVDMAPIAEAKAAVKIPVIANGDICDGESAIKALEMTGADALMIGRAALGNPFVFEKIRAALDNKEYTEPSDLQRIETAKAHLRLLVDLKGERTGVCEGRRHTAYYTKGMYGSADLRHRLTSSVSEAEMISILDDLKRMYENDSTST